MNLDSLRTGMIEGPKAKENFDKTMTKIVSVSHDELKRREEKWKRQRSKKKKQVKS